MVDLFCSLKIFYKHQKWKYKTSLFTDKEVLYIIYITVAVGFCIFTCEDFQKVCFCYQFWFSSLTPKIHSQIKIVSLESYGIFPYFRTGFFIFFTIFSTKMDKIVFVLQIFPSIVFSFDQCVPLYCSAQHCTFEVSF